MDTDPSPNVRQGIRYDHHVTGWRIVAALADFVPLAILFAVMAATIGETETEGSSFSASLGTREGLIFLALTLVYYLGLEGLTGTTLGKMILGLRVVRTDGEHYAWGSVLKRNLLRAIDGLPFLYLVGIISVGSTSMRQRIGESGGPHHQDSGEAKIRESTAGVSRKPSSDCEACGCSSKHLCGLTAWNT